MSLSENTNTYEVTLIEPIKQEKSNTPIKEEKPVLKEQVKTNEPINPPKKTDFVNKIVKKQEKQIKKAIKKVVNKDKKLNKK